jgi:hypothetical protein
MSSRSLQIHTNAMMLHLVGGPNNVANAWGLGSGNLIEDVKLLGSREFHKHEACKQITVSDSIRIEL